jgi:rRNA maturation RNase YbeY
VLIFNYETDFQLEQEENIQLWISKLIEEESLTEGDISYILCDDEYLLKINREYLNHDYYTDIITFDYVEDSVISGDLFISIERIKDNAEYYQVNFGDELLRVLCHGVLHLCGYKDKSDEDEKLMRTKEDFYITLYKKMFHVEQ